jgi:C1A family cysteine protease
VQSDGVLSGIDALHGTRLCGGPRLSEPVSDAEGRWSLMRSLGCILDAPDARDRLYSMGHIVALDGDYPDEMDYTRYVDVVRDQGSTSACVGFALTRAIHVREQIAGNSQAIHGSPLSAYAIGRAYETDGKRALEDVGSRPREVVAAVKEFGIPPETDWPFDEQRVNVVPQWQLQRGEGRELTGYYWLFSEGKKLCEDIARTVSQGYPVCIALPVDPIFMAWSNAEEPIPGPRWGSLRGWHYVPIIGYRKRDGKLEFLTVNSWASSWGDFGFAYLSEELIVTGQSVLAIETTGEEK